MRLGTEQDHCAAVSERGEAFPKFRGLSVAGRVGLAFSAILLPVDLHNLGANSIEVDAARNGKKDKEPKVVKKLRELADEVEKNLPTGKDFAQGP